MPVHRRRPDLKWYHLVVIYGALAIVVCGVLAIVFWPQPVRSEPQEQRPGVAVDSRGGQVIDPTRNVLDLVQAAIKRQDDLREGESRFQSTVRDMESRFQSAMREAETKRVNELAVQKQLFDLELARVLRANVDSAALLLSTQLKEVKTDLSDRTAKLEQFRWETGGKSAGTGEVIAYLIAGFMGLVALAGVTVGVLNMRRSPAS
jgi:hypothetical protein